MIHALLHVLGIDDVSGHWYAFWSGFGSDLTELAIPATAYGMYRKHVCHVHRCWRIGHLPHPDGWTVCRKHHPTGAPRLDKGL